MISAHLWIRRRIGSSATAHAFSVANSDDLPPLPFWRFVRLGTSRTSAESPEVSFSPAVSPSAAARSG